MPLTLTCSNEEKVVGIKVAAKTPAGKPAQFQPGSLAVSIADGNPNATAVVTGDDTYDVVSGDDADGLGSTTFRVTVDADLGDGVVELADLTLLNVTGAIGSVISQTAGTVQPK